MCSAFGAGDEHCEPAVESEHDEDDAVVDIVNAGGSANEQDTSSISNKRKQRYGESNNNDTHSIRLNLNLNMTPS